MKLTEFDYDLPEELIAQEPVEPRDSSRLMVIDRKQGTISHEMFADVLNYLSYPDVIVLNDTKVIKARLRGRKTTGAAVEILLLRDLGEGFWETLVRPGRRLKLGTSMVFGDGRLRGVVTEPTKYGGRVIRFDCSGDFNDVLEEMGHVPLPPYIRKDLADDSRYQTVYAKTTGSSAAPTAGLHFTSDLLEDLAEKGVTPVFITLHVGIDTFKPVSEENIEDHVMHSEFYVISQDAASKINEAKNTGGKVVAVGTTVTRTLETAANGGGICPGSGWTRLFIYPGYKFRIVDSLLTNFHLPKSTLMMLVSAFGGIDLTKRAYLEAIKERYRFFSFGDAMLII